MDDINNMLDLIPKFADEDQIDALREAINERFPPNSNRAFDSGLDFLCELFRELL
jgi:hypothetical protein